jgi:hypothetical protein
MGAFFGSYVPSAGSPGVGGAGVALLIFKINTD